MTTEKDEIDESKMGANASAEGEDADAGGDTAARSGREIIKKCIIDLYKIKNK